MTHKQFNEKSLSEDSQTIFNFLYNYDPQLTDTVVGNCIPSPSLPRDLSQCSKSAAGSNRKQLEWQILPLLFDILGLLHLTDAASKGKRLCYHISQKRGFEGSWEWLCGFAGIGVNQLYMWNYVN